MSNYKRLFLENTYLFITIVTFKRKPILIENIELLRESFKRAKQIYNFEIFASVILPDHIHMILIPTKIEEYPKIIFAIKYHFSKNSNVAEVNLSESKRKKGDKGIWQRRYWEHTISTQEDLNNHLDYIHYNPVKHKYAKTPKDWPYSSFDKFIKMNYYEPDWGCEDNIETMFIMDLD